MDRPKPINLKDDFRSLNIELNQRGDNHLEGVMSSTKETAVYIRKKDRRYD